MAPPDELYDRELATARRMGAANATDVGLMALFCEHSLQMVVGAVSPRLVFNGAQDAGMTALELTRLASTDPGAVADLMWSA